MHQLFNHARNAALCIAGVALAWVLFFKLNAFVFSYFEKTEFVNLVFIPAGVRLVAVLLFDELGVIGLFFGALITSPSFSTNINEAILISLVSALNPYLAVHITRRLLKVDHLLSQLNAKELVLMGLFSALFNCLSHHFYFEFANLRASWADCENMFIGDIFGIGIILTLFVICLKLIRKCSALPVEQKSNQI
jgi:hypothetical protein